MLTLKIRGREMWDESKEEFVYTGGGTLLLEHSLVSISKWEAKHGRSFLSGGPKPGEETMDYFRCMSVGDNDEALFDNLTHENISEILKYIESPMTATYLREDRSGGSSSEKITSELVYYWMISLGIPFECQYWHLNRLMTLIRVCAAKQRGGKHSKKEMLRSNAALNAARRAKSGSRG